MRSGRDNNICFLGFLVFFLISYLSLSLALTNPDDVAAINSLFLALESPLLPGWVASGGDPCGESWQGVLCNASQVETIILISANLGGELGVGLNMFTSLKAMDFSNNHIGGSIPSTLPDSLQNLFLSGNKFTGTIPESLSSLKSLSVMSLNNNLLSGKIPDVFQDLGLMINLDLSSNNLSGPLPPSMQNLSTLTSLLLQNNHLSGELDVLQDLPLKDLNVENNLFNGPIPEKLLGIPNFIKGGNLFNVTIAPSPSPETPPSPTSPKRPFLGPPSTNASTGHGQAHVRSPPSDHPSRPTPQGEKDSFTSKRIIWISILGAFSFLVLALVCLLFGRKCLRRREDSEQLSKPHLTSEYGRARESSRSNASMLPPSDTFNKDKEAKPKERIGGASKLQSGAERSVGSESKQESHEIDMNGNAMDLMYPSSIPPIKRVIEKATVPAEASLKKPSSKSFGPLTSVKHFTVASLQQHTNSFSQENLIGTGMLGSVYRAEFPGGKLLVVMKLDKKSSKHTEEGKFVELVNNIDRIRHANIVQLVGFCSEHSQRLLIHEYCRNGTLHDLLHTDDRLMIKLSWNIRVRMALEAARALEYLHEICNPPSIHQNFKSANILLDDDLRVHVSDCGLASLISSGAVSQLSGQLLAAYGYGAPEFEYGIYTMKCDVYSFGVVMLELLTGRQSYDKKRDRGEQFLVRWAIPQLHDIDALAKMVDSSLKGDYPAKSLSHFADVISRCVQSEPEFRPLMSEVVQDLSDMIQREHRRNNSNGDNQYAGRK
ncbi:Serine-threonine/tyrosine-protein kinase catalytic domain [Arabidopsis thaliana x Arabidopsis arenosa]|uniref:Serine-threonine/tyrosine-protein kinase catalytic domain n=1 Tax=Arabidopsis thaliana x Arabidopsis arenosa TaxID=1240361 RepID=A0A8T2B0P7_9BRAS|nr:Serine-threonine/tyrosine-protein kinase catalytic domain [Arabidopsis thaliana x Arabidopsis arenosa]